MEQLTKERLTELIYDICRKVTESNVERCRENICSSIEGTEDPNALIVRLMVAYGMEIKKECCDILVETLYEIFYPERSGEEGVKC